MMFISCTALCSSWNFLASHDVKDFQHRTVALVLQSAQAAVNGPVADNVQNFVEQLHANRGAEHFSLVAFNRTEARNLINTADSARFVQAVKDWASADADNASAIVNTFEAIRVAAQTALYKPAVVYVFASRNPSIRQAPETLELLAEGGVQVNVLLVTEEDPTAWSNFNYYQQVAYATGGRLLHLGAAANVAPLVRSYLPKTVYENGLVEDLFFPNCSQTQELEFPLEKRNGWLSLLVRGQGARDNIKLFDPSGRQAQTRPIVQDANSVVIMEGRQQSWSWVRRKKDGIRGRKDRLNLARTSLSFQTR